MNYYTIMHHLFFIAVFAISAWCLYKIAVTDWRRRIIPDAFLFPLMISGLIVTAFWPAWPHGIRAAIVGGALGYAMAAGIGFLFDIRMRKRNPSAPAPIGMGDIKLIFTGGIWLGPGGLAWALAAACIFGTAWGRHKKQKYIPFAPFFIIGGILSFIGILILL